MAQVELGERIATLREEQALTQSELAERARISPSTLSQIESGRVPRPHVGTIRKIARALDVEPQDLRRAEELALPKDEAPRAAGQAQASTVGEFEQKLAHVLEPARADALRESQAASRLFSSQGIPQSLIGDIPEAEVGKRFLEEFPPDERAAAFGELAVGYARFERANENLEANYTRARDLLQEHDEKIDQLQKQLKQEKEAYARLTQENTRLRQDIAELRSEAEQERETTR